MLVMARCGGCDAPFIIIRYDRHSCPGLLAENKVRLHNLGEDWGFYAASTPPRGIPGDTGKKLVGPRCRGREERVPGTGGRGIVKHRGSEEPKELVEVELVLVGWLGNRSSYVVGSTPLARNGPFP